MHFYPDRQAAASKLADELAPIVDDRPLVLALSNGGVPLATVLADRLDAPLDFLLLARLYSAEQDDRVVAAVDEHGRISMVDRAPRWDHHATHLVQPARLAFSRLQRRRSRYRATLPESDVRGRTVVVVSDGITTGAAVEAAIASVRDRGARRVIVAAPVGAAEGVERLEAVADDVVVPHRPARFRGVEHAYANAEVVTDAEVEKMLRAWTQHRGVPDAGVKTLVMRVIANGQRVVHCEIDLPPGAARGSGPFPAVIFAHSLESHGRSPRILPVSQRLAKRGVVGVRPDFTGHGRSEGSASEATPQRMLEDLRTVIENVRVLQEIDPQRLGLCGAGTGAIAALHLAASEPGVASIVVRGPMWGGEVEASRAVRAPTLFIHGDQDPQVDQVRRLPAAHRSLVIRGATRWFNDPISLELMVGATVDWHVDHLQSAPQVDPPAVWIDGPRRSQAARD